MNNASNKLNPATKSVCVFLARDHTLVRAGIPYRSNSESN
jgi:hypothetical protein